MSSPSLIRKSLCYIRLVCMHAKGNKTSETKAEDTDEESSSESDSDDDENATDDDNDGT